MKPIATIPLVNVGLDTQYNEAADQACNHSHTPLLRNILAVGAHLDPETDNNLSPRDKVWIKHAINVCKLNNFRIAPDAQIMPLNLNHGQDYLDPKLELPHPPDVVISCFIPDYNKSCAYFIENMGDRTLTPEKLYQKTLNRYENNPDLFVSPHHTKDAWHKAAKRFGATVTIAISKLCDVDSSSFLSSGYKAGISQTIVFGEITYKIESAVRRDFWPRRLPPRIGGTLEFIESVYRRSL